MVLVIGTAILILILSIIVYKYIVRSAIYIFMMMVNEIKGVGDAQKVKRLNHRIKNISMPVVNIQTIFIFLILVKIYEKNIMHIFNLIKEYIQ